MLHHLTNIGPHAGWKIDAIRRKFPELPLVVRDYPCTMTEFGDIEGYDEGVAIMNDLHSMGFERKLTDQESFEFWQAWFNLRKEVA